MEEYQTPKKSQSMSDLLKSRVVPVKVEKEQFEFEALAEEMTAHFGKHQARRIYPLFYNVKYTVPKIRDAWFTYQKQPIKTFNYFCGILNKT
jgi:hypothetical protein